MLLLSSHPSIGSILCIFNDFITGFVGELAIKDTTAPSSSFFKHIAELTALSGLKNCLISGPRRFLR